MGMTKQTILVNLFIQYFCCFTFFFLIKVFIANTGTGLKPSLSFCVCAMRKFLSRLTEVACQDIIFLLAFELIKTRDRWAGKCLKNVNVQLGGRVYH